MKMIKEYKTEKAANVFADKISKSTKILHVVKKRREGGFAVWQQTTSVKKKTTAKKKAIRIVKQAAKPPSKAVKTVKNAVKKAATELNLSSLIGKAKSSVASPVAAVWEICDEFHNQSIKKDVKMSRKKVIEFCVNRGIAFYTARTQYQTWKTAKGI